MAVCLLESANGADGEAGSNDTEEKKKEWKEEAINLMARVPGLRQKIAGKSIPLEVRLTVHLICPNPTFIPPHKSYICIETRRT